MRMPKLGFEGLGYYTQWAKKFIFQKSSVKVFTALSEYETGLKFSLRDNAVIQTQFTQPHNYAILSLLRTHKFITEEYLERKFFRYMPSKEWIEMTWTVRMTDMMYRGKSTALGIDILMYLSDPSNDRLSSTMIETIGYEEGGMVCLAKDNLLFEGLVKKSRCSVNQRLTSFNLTPKGLKLVEDINLVQELIKPFLKPETNDNQSS